MKKTILIIMAYTLNQSFGVKIFINISQSCKTPNKPHFIKKIFGVYLMLIFYKKAFENQCTTLELYKYKTKNINFVSLMIPNEEDFLKRALFNSVPFL